MSADAVTWQPLLFIRSCLLTLSVAVLFCKYFAILSDVFGSFIFPEWKKMLVIFHLFS